MTTTVTPATNESLFTILRKLFIEMLNLEFLFRPKQTEPGVVTRKTIEKCYFQTPSGNGFFPPNLSFEIVYVLKVYTVLGTFEVEVSEKYYRCIFERDPIVVNVQISRTNNKRVKGSLAR